MARLSGFRGFRPIKGFAMLRAIAVALLGLLSSLGAGAQVLIPIPPVGIVPEAFGSEWETELWIYNDSDEPITVGRLPVILPAQNPVVPPRRTIKMPAFPSFLSGAAFITEGPDTRLRFELHVRELTRQSEDWGVELPLVPFDEFSTDSIQLLNIAIDPDYRITPRIYALFTDETPARFTMRLYELEGDSSPRFERRIEIPSPPLPPPNQIGSDVGFTVMTEIFQTAQSDPTIRRTRLEIKADEPGQRFWSFASATNNVTQRVTAFTP